MMKGTKMNILDYYSAEEWNAIKSETDSATDMLAYSNAPSKFKSSPKKRLTDMTPDELNKALDELM